MSCWEGFYPRLPIEIPKRDHRCGRKEGEGERPRSTCAKNIHPIFLEKEKEKSDAFALLVRKRGRGGVPTHHYAQKEGSLPRFSTLRILDRKLPPREGGGKVRKM